jgi:hypothetical protein
MVPQDSVETFDNELIPVSIHFLVMFAVIQLLSKVPALYEIRMFISLLTRAKHWTATSARDVRFSNGNVQWINHDVDNYFVNIHEFGERGNVFG